MGSQRSSALFYESQAAMLLTAALTDCEETARAALKRATQRAHDRIEATRPMRALMGSAPDAACVRAAIRGQAAVIAALEARAARSGPALRAPFADYVPRAPLAAADLERLGAAPTWPEAETPALDGAAAWLGFRYVVEGSSLGGALIRRRLAERAPDLPPLGFFDPHGEARGAVWRAFCDRLDATLRDPRSRAAAANAANAVFAALTRSLERQTA
jgi:heme oxygenase